MTGCLFACLFVFVCLLLLLLLCLFFRYFCDSRLCFIFYFFYFFAPSAFLHFSSATVQVLVGM